MPRTTFTYNRCAGRACIVVVVVVVVPPRPAPTPPRPPRQARSTNLSSADGVLIGQIRPGDGAARLIAARLVWVQVSAKLDLPGDPLGTPAGENDT